MINIDQEMRDKIAKSVQGLVEKIVEDKSDRAGLCILYSLVGYWLLKKLDMPVQLQVGSAQWQMREFIEGEDCPTHFAYIYDNTLPPSFGFIREQHTWLAVPSRNWLIDFSTCDIPDQAYRMIGERFILPPPPPYIWWDIHEDSNEEEKGRIIYQAFNQPTIAYNVGAATITRFSAQAFGCDLVDVVNQHAEDCYASQTCPG